MRELPRQLTADELAEPLRGRTALVERLAEIENPLGNADDVLRTLTEDEKLEALAAHPAIGAARGTVGAVRQPSKASTTIRPCWPSLQSLNRRYEERFGFRFVVFVNRRPKAEIVPVLRERLEKTRDEELDTALSELVAIARDRWQRA